MPRTRASGWSVEITHPQTNRTIHPEIASEPQFSPSLNSLPEIRIPIPKDATWLDGQFDDDPAMSVHLDGNELPIDTLVDVRDSPAGTVLVGRGGDELTDRVTEEYRAARRHIAAETLVNNETSYATDFDTPTAEIREGQTFQTATTTSDFNDVFGGSFSASDPVRTDGDEIKMAKVCFVGGTDDILNIQNANLITNDSAEDWEEDDYYELGHSGGTDSIVEFQFTPEYDIPAENVKLFALLGPSTIDDTAADDGATITAEVNNNVVFSINGLIVNNFNWVELDNVGYSGEDLSAGGVANARIELLQDPGTGNSLDVDCIAVIDDRYESDLNFATSTGFSGNMPGPENYPESVTVTGAVETAAFQVIAGNADIEIDTTSTTQGVDNQSLQVSNDAGANWYPQDGTEENTASVDVDFPDTGTTIQLRIELSRYGTAGTQDDTPTVGFATNTVTETTIKADLRLESSLVDERFDASLAEVLTEIAGAEYVWSYRIDGGTPTVAWAEQGQRIASDDPDLADSQIRKNVDTWNEVTISGSNLGTAGENAQASLTFEPLDNDDILPGSETVYADDGTDFDRSVDYEIDYATGQIRATASGGLTVGNTYNVDYRHQVQGTHTASTPVTRTFTETIPGVTSDRQAEQIAFVLAEVEPEIQTPRYEGKITVPRVDATFDPLEALQLADLDLPDAATPLAPQGQPQITPEGIVFDVGSAPKLGEFLSDIRGTVQATARRS